MWDGLCPNITVGRGGAEGGNHFVSRAQIAEPISLISVQGPVHPHSSTLILNGWAG